MDTELAAQCLATGQVQPKCLWPAGGKFHESSALEFEPKARGRNLRKRNRKQTQS
ncbi:hypothetical protein ACRRTK_002389 [Alexandromys fortis]